MTSFFSNTSIPGGWGMLILWCSVLCSCIPAPTSPAPDIRLFDFESGTWEGWDVDTTVFGSAPVSSEEIAEWGDRAPVGMQGRYMAATGEARHDMHPDGRMVSTPFTVRRTHLTFLLAGEVHPQVRICLEVDGDCVREAFGNNAYDLVRRGWDVSSLRGRQARLVVEDHAARRSLIRVDDFRLTDTPPAPLGAFDVSRRQVSDLVRPGEFRLLVDAYALGEGMEIYHHSIVRGHDERWHLFASLGDEQHEWAQENVRTLIHASADDLSRGAWTLHGTVLTADHEQGDHFIRDPEVVFHDGNYYLFYVGSGTGFGGWQEDECLWREGRFLATEDCSHGPFSIHLATSQDGDTWTRLGAVFTDSPFTATPAVKRVADQWVMYYGAADPPETMGKHAIAYRTSLNLLDWSRERGIALKDTSRTTPWPEHPFIQYPVVVRRGESWYLFAGSINNDNLSRYHALWPFQSHDPFQWTFSSVPPHGRLFVDGGAEILRDDDDRWHVSTGNVMVRGVWLAPLYWNDDTAQ